ncbi:MAG: hypothetical protein MI807_06630 [Verrucomicrobiales bacterium]|nr:hypothetical protein [Verrucomicrobiales bacterium]
MNRPVVCLVVCIATVFSLAKVNGNDFADHPYFSKIVGEWHGEGELTSADGEVIPIREDWSAKVNDEGGFTVEGDRVWGEESQQFHWIFEKNAATELIECEYWHTGMDEALRFQVNLSDDGVEMRAPIGDGEITVQNTFEKGKITGGVSLVGADGQVGLGGSLKHVRKN